MASDRWIPIGHSSVLPIHAAGYHSISSQKRNTTLDRVISSYTPTARALAHARSQFLSISKERQQTILLTSMAKTPEHSPLPWAEKEVHSVESVLPQTIHRKFLPQPTISEVLRELKMSSVAHFACHGEANIDPSKSRILLSDWKETPFTVSEMVRLKLKYAELIYLSTCHTANNRNMTLLDEAIHMSSACQLAGFPAVVGTMWQISDNHAATIAKYFYTSILTMDGRADIARAAECLHQAVRKLRDDSKVRMRSKILIDPYGVGSIYICWYLEISILAPFRARIYRSRWRPS